MFNLGPFELVAIFVVALLVFGPDKLPEMGRQVGKAVREFRKFQASMQGQVREVLDPITAEMNSNGPSGPPATNIRGGEIPAGSNVPRSATIQNPQPDGEEATAPGTYGYYAPVDPPAPATPQNGPAPDAGETTAPGSSHTTPAAGDTAPAGEATPPPGPSGPDAR